MRPFFLLAASRNTSLIFPASSVSSGSWNFDFGPGACSPPAMNASSSKLAQFSPQLGQ